MACTELPPLMLRQGRHAGEDLRVLGRHMHTERGCDTDHGGDNQQRGAVYQPGVHAFGRESDHSDNQRT